MSTIAEHHTALQTACDTISGLRAFDVPPQGGNPPFAFPRLLSWEPISFQRANHKRYLYEIVVVTAETVRPQDGYKLLMEYADSGAKSIDKAVWDLNDRAAGTFNSLATTTGQVTGFDVREVIDFDELQGYGGAFTVEILTKG